MSRTPSRVHSQPATPAWLRIDRVLSGEDLRGIGVGTWGSGTKVAVRWAPDPRAGGPDGKSATSPEAEYSALASIPSRGTPDPLDLVAWNGRVFSVTRWIAARRWSRLSGANVERLAMQLCDVLAISHESGWVHGDIRPENIVLDRAGDVFLVDWEGASKIGGRCGAGTLGYAPHWAWSGSYLADPANDFYSLAVVIWEAWNGRVAFTGDRATVIQSQSGFDFACDAAPPNTLQALFDSARARRAVTGRPNARRAGGLGPVDPARALTALVRRRLSSAASTAITTIGDGGLLFVDVPGMKLGDEQVVVAAMIDELRTRWSLPCMTLDIAAAHSRRSVAPFAARSPTSLSRSDQLRGRRLRLGATARSIINLARSSVVVCAAGSRLSSAVRAEVAQRNRQFRHRSDEPPIPAIAESRIELDAMVRRDLLLETARVTLTATAVMGATRLAIEQRLAPSLCDITDLVDDVSQRSERSLSAGELAANRRQAPTEASKAASSRLSRRHVRGEHERGLQRWLLMGERAAAAGRTQEVFRHCVRCQSRLSGSAGTRTSDLIRLADLWIECGRGDAAELVLRRIRSKSRRADVAVRLGRVLSGRNDVEGLRAHIGQCEAAPDDRELELELDRLRAIVAMHDGDKRAALAFGMQALGRARQASDVSGVWAAITLGNVARSVGRPASARRILRLARQRATAIGSVRLSIVAGGNLLQILQARESPSKAAQDAADLAAECRKWGMTSESATLTCTAAALAIIGHEPKRAVQWIEAFWRDQCPRTYVKPSIAQVLQRRWRDAVDLAESWPEIERIARGEPDRSDLSTDLHRRLLRLELGIDRWKPATAGGESAEGSSPASLWESLRDLLESQLDAVAFASRLVSLSDDVASESPVLGHIARVIVQVETERSRTDRLLGLVRLSELDSPTTERLMEAIRMLATCYGPPEVAAAVRHHPAVSHSAQEWARPPGVRRWEWQTWLAQMAHAGAIDATDGTSVAGAIVRAEDVLSSLSPNVRAQYCPRLPYEAWRRSAGLGEIDLPNLESIDLATAPLTLFRAWLDRNGASGTQEHARMVGLERVVQNALRLRATADVDTVLRQVALGVLEVGRAERAVVIYDQASGPGIAIVAAGGSVNYEPVAAAEVSSSAIERVRGTGHACIVDDACGDGDLGSKPSVKQYRARSLVIAPLRVRGRSLGYIYVENRSAARSFSGSDAEIIEGFAAQAALALENAQLVSELRATCDTLQAARNDAVRQESLRMIGRTASEVAHDLNNLLTAVLGESQLLLQGHLSADVRQSLQIIERAVLDGTAIVGRIQGSTKTQARRTPAGVRVRQLAVEVAEAVRRTAGARGIAIETVLGASDPGVRGVAAELREVLTNVVMNAVDASGAGGVVKVAMDCIADRVEIRVEDRGCGMSPETVARAFDPFFTTKGAEGNGLGLSIAKGIVERHGGTIQIASVAERGTTVAIAFPIIPSDDSATTMGEKIAGRSRQ